MRISDWSSDVCSSDLQTRDLAAERPDEKAFRLLVLLIDIEHRIVAERAVDRRARNARIARNAVIGLHPHAALGVDAQTVGAGEGVTFDIADEVAAARRQPIGRENV